MSKTMKIKKSARKPKTHSPEFMEKLKQYVRTEGVGFLSDNNISSVGIGYKTVEGKPTKEIAIQFTVKEKAVPELLESLDTAPIPPIIEIDGVAVPTDVVQRKFQTDFRVVSENDVNRRKIRLDPIEPGASVANVHVTAGTICCIVYDKIDGTPYILSNWHVLHGSDGTIGDDVVQPGPRDDNRVNLNFLGKLVRSHLGAAGDCAIATIVGRTFTRKIFDLDVEVDQLGEPELGDKVIKSGRTTEVTHGKVNRIHVVVKINYGGNVGEQTVGGFEIGPDENNPAPNNQISMGGDSGSGWIFKSANGKPTKVLAGLHFAGEGPGDPNDHAIACYPTSVFEKLGITLSPPITQSAEFSGIGYNPNFLSENTVNIPKLSSANAANVYKKDGSSTIDYTHFSLALSKTRRFAYWVAWNIDGSSIKKLSRDGIPFILDPDIPANFQAGDELYKNNRLDRGHIARRADLLWGSFEEANRANVDSFFFTNMTPQMDNFNQGGKGGIWGKLEDAIFEDTKVDDLRVSVFGGPIFNSDNRIYRGIKIPREFFKVIVYVEEGTLKAKGFILTQNLIQLEAFELDEFKTYEAQLTEIEQRCGFTFPANVRNSDGFAESLRSRPESTDERRPLESLTDISW